MSTYLNSRAFPFAWETAAPVSMELLLHTARLAQNSPPSFEALQAIVCETLWRLSTNVIGRLEEWAQYRQLIFFPYTPLLKQGLAYFLFFLFGCAVYANVCTHTRVCAVLSTLFIMIP